MFHVDANDFESWRELARELLKREVSPNDIAWEKNNQASLLFGDDQDFLSLEIKHTVPTIPRDFFSSAKSVACYRDDSRWSLLYSIAWRLMFEDRNVLDFKIDEQVSRFHSMRKAIGRDIHKMEAFVRFRKLNTALDDASIKIDGDQEYYVAWFEPEHLIVRLAAPFFVKRFNNMSWSILTPDLCAHWDGKELSFTEGLPQGPKVEDELEDLWLEYYANIFNPARLKLKAMQAEMPKKYWHNLPEAPLIAELTRKSASRMENMLADSTTEAWKKTAKSRFVKNKQDALRDKREENKKYS